MCLVLLFLTELCCWCSWSDVKNSPKLLPPRTLCRIPMDKLLLGVCMDVPADNHPGNSTTTCSREAWCINAMSRASCLDYFPFQEHGCSLLNEGCLGFSRRHFEYHQRDRTELTPRERKRLPNHLPNHLVTLSAILSGQHHCRNYRGRLLPAMEELARGPWRRWWGRLLANVDQRPLFAPGMWENW